MRKKVSIDQKKKSITFTINPYLEELLIKHIEKIGINKSKFIESLIENELKK